MRIYFQFLESQHVPLIYAWFQTPHIKKWYGSEQEWTIEAIEKKYNPHRLQANKIAAFIIYDKQIPIGYIQKYSVSDYSWEGLDLSKLASKLAGIDLFIGNPTYLYQGFGQLILKQFLTQQIQPYFQECLVDPRCDNYAAIRCYEKVGFEFYQTVLCGREALYIMKKNLTHHLVETIKS
ncbi:Uncharacterized protein PRO82_000987 [Candidatus Protochlamydia amoebophila]|uniref:GNAT family N-acetyltransferase n=1 Tax=Candidatus Protochlamydia amoebophila TaxID=362787 RepID=UPI001BD8A01B|nr:GNAT family N-acetyltransferase [Candidatus Protochlamydia amoebophila]MBS4163684.1 Uncharacterized protein [Candidatus Protochlamydia amoebophila]